MDESVRDGRPGPEAVQLGHPVENEALFRLGDALRRRREELGLTLKDVGPLVSISPSRLSLLERGQYPRVTSLDVKGLARALKLSTDETSEVLRLLEVASLPPSAMAVVGLRGVSRTQQDIAKDEGKSKRISHFSLHLVPGLLQLPAYSAGIFQRMSLSGRAAREALHARQVRQQILADGRRQFRFVVTESVLYTRVCDPAEQLHQLNWLKMMSGRPNIGLRVLPAASGNDFDALHGFTVLDRRAVRAETMLQYLDSRRTEDVDYFLAVFDRLWQMTTAHETDAMLDSVISQHPTT